MEKNIDKKQKKSNKFLDALIEIAVEIGAGLLFMGVGALVAYLCGVDLGSENTDWELVTLIGAIIFIVGLFLVAFIVNFFKKKKEKKNSELLKKVDFESQDDSADL